MSVKILLMMKKLSMVELELELELELQVDMGLKMRKMPGKMSLRVTLKIGQSTRGMLILYERQWKNQMSRMRI
ncbi:Uncharacterised protein [Lelliottia amnigena]|nr:Uncharacterised protein [Lelliottia amnigena]